MTTVEQDIMALADLIGRKEVLIRDMRNAVKRLKDNELAVSLSLTPKSSGVLTRSNSNDLLQEAINSQAEWIIDRVYDTAIQNLEKEIAPLLEKIQQDKEKDDE